MSDGSPILVTGAAGSIGGVGRTIVQILRAQNLPVRALVHHLNERSDSLTEMGAEVVAADLANGADVVRAFEGCQRIYFGMSVSLAYLQATAVVAAAAKEIPNLEVLVNISQMTVSEMTLTKMTESPQQQQHWLGEQMLNWSGVPVVHVRATVFLEHPFFSMLAPASIAKNGTIRLPFGTGRSSPVAAYDVAQTVATILQNPKPHIGKVYELTGPRSESMDEIAQEYQEALGRPVKYVNVPFEEWCDKDLRKLEISADVYKHFLVMAKLHAENRYDRLTNDVEKITGQPSMSIKEYIARHPELFAKARYHL